MRTYPLAARHDDFRSETTIQGFLEYKADEVFAMWEKVFVIIEKGALQSRELGFTESPYPPGEPLQLVKLVPQCGPSSDLTTAVSSV